MRTLKLLIVSIYNYLQNNSQKESHPSAILTVDGTHTHACILLLLHPQIHVYKSVHRWGISEIYSAIQEEKNQLRYQIKDLNPIREQKKKLIPFIFLFSFLIAQN